MQINKTKYGVRTGKKSESEANGSTFSEQLAELANADCEAFNVPFFFRVDEDEKKAEFRKGTCKMWACETCGAREAKRWIARLIDGCNKLPVSGWYFATITAHRKWRGKRGSLKNIRTNWHKLRKRLREIALLEDGEFYYARVWEAHKDGSFHMHLITNAPASTRWLKDNAVQCGLGYQAKIDSVVNAGQVAGYVSKYMLKSMPNSTHYPKGARRIEVSRNWVRWHEKGDSEWNFLRGLKQAQHRAERYRKANFRVFDNILKHEEKRRDNVQKETVEKLREKDKKS